MRVRLTLFQRYEVGGLPLGKVEGNYLEISDLDEAVSAAGAIRGFYRSMARNDQRYLAAVASMNDLIDKIAKAAGGYDALRDKVSERTRREWL